MSAFPQSLVLISTLALAGCETINTGKALVTAGGAVGGALLVDQAAKKLSKDERMKGVMTEEELRTVGIAAGAIAGGLIANAIYSRLTAEDRTGVENATRQTASTGEAQTYTNPATGVVVRTRVLDQKTQTGNRRIPVMKDRVQEFPPTELIGEMFVAQKDTPILAGPGKDFRNVGQLAKGSNIHVIGRVKNADWYVVEERGAAGGFVAKSALKVAETGAQRTVQPASTPVAPAETIAQTVETTASVRTIEQIVTIDGVETVEKVTVASSPTGWEVVEPAKT